MSEHIVEKGRNSLDAAAEFQKAGKQVIICSSQIRGTRIIETDTRPQASGAELRQS